MAWTERYVRADAAGSGDGTTDTNSGANGAWTWAEMATNMAAGQRVNVKAGTYTLTAIVSSANAGTLSSPIWIRGFTTTIGDLDTAPTSQRTPGTDTPLISHTANYSLFSGQHVNWSNICFKSSVSTRPALYARTYNGFFSRCRFEHTGTGSTDYACRVDLGNYKVFRDCYFINSNASATASVFYSLFYCDLINCIFESAAAVTLLEYPATIGLIESCVFNGGSIGISSSVAPGVIHIRNNTFYAQSSDAIKLTWTTAGGPAIIIKNYFHTIGGYAINASAATLGNVFIAGNCYYNLTSGQLNGIFESLQFDALTDSSDKFVDKASKDFTLVESSSGYGVAGLYEKTGPTSYGDVGAMQHANPASGGGGGALILGGLGHTGIGSF